jgi:nucleoid-associated protein YgaU
MNWNPLNTAKRNAPTATFNGGGPEKITLKLFLEHSYCGLLGVQGYVSILKMLMKKPPILLDHPPLVMFAWGLTTSQMSYIDSINYEYTLFSPGGKPLQAEVELSLVEYNIEWLSMLPLNPTSRSEARKTWVVTEGQTIDWIAYQEYGDAAAWRHIAKVNNLMNPMGLKPGQILKLTPLV